MRAEYLPGEALAHYLAANGAAAAVLQEQIMWRVPIEEKPKLLSEVMDAHDYSDTFPFVIPVLTGLFKIRNMLAHSLEQVRPEHLHEIGYLSVHRGRLAEHPLRMDALDWLWRQGNQVASELWLISGVLRVFCLGEDVDAQAEDTWAEYENYPGKDDPTLFAFIPDWLPLRLLRNRHQRRSLYHRRAKRSIEVVDASQMLVTVAWS